MKGDALYSSAIKQCANSHSATENTTATCTCTCICTCEVIQPCSDESQEEAYIYITHVFLLFLTHKEILNKFLICTMEITVPKFPYSVSGTVLFRMYADGDGKGPDQIINYLDVFEFFHKKLTTQFRTNLHKPQHCSLTAIGSKKYSKKPNITWYFSRMRMGRFRRSRSQIPTCVIQSNMPHSELLGFGFFQVECCFVLSF